MRLVLFERAGGPPRPGLLTERGVVSAAEVVPAGATPQATMVGLIDGFERLRPALETLAATGTASPLESVRLRAPLPRPGKILACIANYWEHGAMEARPLNMFLKNPDAVVGPGDTIVLPEFTEPWIFMHEAELALVIRGPAKGVRKEDWRSAVFGYTGMIDVSARGEGRRTWKTGSWLGKSFDTFAPLGPCIATGLDPHRLHIEARVNGDVRQSSSTDRLIFNVPTMVAFVSQVMTLYPGDVIATGTPPGIGPLARGDVVEIEIEGIGVLRNRVV
ncbi:MAG TPA: fumarylacetoacetate hydrolase family protein [Vicinamibacteria bacterium]|nr:fumarylacetoacetate hydrolase family protein [Vicinamibacteria bacterium]